MTVNIVVLPDWARKTKYKPLPAPVFPDGPPSQADIALALELFAELDSESQRWYGERFEARLRDRLPK